MRRAVTDRYPASLAAIARGMEHECELRRHRASEEAIGRCAAELDGKTFKSDGYLIRPAASVQEILDEANAQSNCVASFIDKYARPHRDIADAPRRQPRRVAGHRQGARRTGAAGLPESPSAGDRRAAARARGLVRRGGLPHTEGREDAEAGDVAPR